MIQEKKIKIDLYHSQIRVMLTDSFDEVNRKFGISYYTDKDDIAAYVCHPDCIVKCKDSSDYIMIFKVQEVCIKHIAHEIVHTKNLLWNKLGMHSEFNNDEHEAYLVGHLTKEIYNFIEAGKAKFNETTNKGSKVA